MVTMVVVRYYACEPLLEKDCDPLDEFKFPAAKSEAVIIPTDLFKSPTDPIKILTSLIKIPTSPIKIPTRPIKIPTSM